VQEPLVFKGIGQDAFCDSSAGKAGLDAAAGLETGIF